MKSMNEFIAMQKVDELPDSVRQSVMTSLEARTRWGTMALSAILRCAGTEGIGMRHFLELADVTQRKLVGGIAKEFYADQMGLVEDSLKTFIEVTYHGVTGCGFDYEVDAGSTEERCKMEQVRCPIINHAHLAGYNNGDAELHDLSAWCDTYDNFESAAVAPSTVMVHSHCLGRNDRSCRLFMEPLPKNQARGESEPIYDYITRLRDQYRAADPSGPWVIDGKTEDEIEQLRIEALIPAVEIQDELTPTWEAKAKMGSEIWGRIGAVSTIMAGELLGWDEFVSSMSDKQGPLLKKVARDKAEDAGITGDSPKDAARLHEALIAGQGYAGYEISEENDNRLCGSCGNCPIIEWGVEGGMAKGTKSVMQWCSAARTYEAQALSPDLTHTYTKCLGKGDDVCQWVIEKRSDT